MTQRTYYDDGTPEWEWWTSPEPQRTRRRDSVVLRHGLTYDDLDHAARIATSRTSGGALTVADRYEHAWGAAAIALCEGVEGLTFQDLVDAAWRGLVRASAQVMRHHGVHDKTWQIRPSFRAYWQATPSDTPEDRITDRIALSQIWPHLTPRQQDVIVAVATYGSPEAATEALGLAPSTVRAYLHHGRARAAALWWEGETPRPVQSRSRRSEVADRCTRGHEYTPENTLWRWRRERRSRTRACRACSYDRTRARRKRLREEVAA